MSLFTLYFHRTKALRATSIILNELAMTLYVYHRSKVRSAAPISSKVQITLFAFTVFKGQRQ